MLLLFVLVLLLAMAWGLADHQLNAPIQPPPAASVKAVRPPQAAAPLAPQTPDSIKSTPLQAEPSQAPAAINTEPPPPLDPYDPSKPQESAAPAPAPAFRADEAS